MTITARVTQAGTVTNTASVTASDQPDPDPTDNTASVTVTTETIADLAVTKTLTGPAIPGLATTYTIVVTNLGPSPVTAASVTDMFPAALVAPTWTCVADPGSSCAAASGTGNLATTVTLEAGDRATFTVTGLIAANATGLLVNTATVTAPAGAVDGDTTNNTRDQLGDAHAVRGCPGHQGRPRHRGGRDQRRLHDHRHECGAVGCHRRHAHRPDAPRPDVRVERRRLHDGLPVHPRHAAPRRDPHDHGNLRDPVRLYDAGSDRKHGNGLEYDAGRGQRATTARRRPRHSPRR